MPPLSFHEPGRIETYGGSDFLLPGLCCRFSAAERREGAVASGADRILFFLIEDTIYFRVHFNRLPQSGPEHWLLAFTIFLLRTPCFPTCSRHSCSCRL